jgi:hypothetical protein
LSELELLSEIGQNARMKPNVKDKACQVLFSIVGGEKTGYKSNIYKPARKNLISLIQSHDPSTKIIYVMMCVEKIND